MTLSVRRSALERMHAHARAGFPHEVVGILAGSRAARRVVRVEALENERADSPANRYQVSGLLILRAEQRLESEGFEVIGYYHSHPDHPARYSEFDRDHALPNMSYVIVSVRGASVAETLSWRLREDRSAMDPETLILEEEALVTIHIPTPLRPYTDNQPAVRVEGSTVGEALGSLLTRHEALTRHLRDGDGKLRSFVNIYVGEDDIRHLQGEATPVTAGSELMIVPSIAGGR